MKLTLITILALGLCLASCSTTSRSLPKDFKSLKALAEQGVAPAQFNLGLKYYGGKGVSQDYKEAIKWYRKAAEQGNAGGQGNLGYMYQYGNGDEDAKKNKGIVAKEMTPDQIAKSEALAKEMIAKNPKLIKKP